jgi:hypothetical protein
MITTLELENYRGFGHYRLSGLARVNLLVGKNNSGKTSVLEAVQLLASEGDQRVFAEIARRRGEMVFVSEDRQDPRRRIDPRDDINLPYPTISHFFRGHQFNIGTSFTLNSDNAIDALTVKISVADELNAPRDTLAAYAAGALVGWSDLPLAFFVLVQGGTNFESRVASAFPISEEGAISLERAIHSGRLARQSREKTTNVQFVTADSLDLRGMRVMWDSAITRGQEIEIYQALQILEPNLIDVQFLATEFAYSLNQGGVLLAFKDSKQRLPLGSYGDGMRRLLALSLALVQTQGGILLIDEIDTGLHYSVMGDLWRLIVETAMRYRIQVFATTHSSDCVRGLAWLCDNYPDLGAEVSLQTIEPALSKSIAHDAEQIKIAVNQGVEVR